MFIRCFQWVEWFERTFELNSVRVIYFVFDNSTYHRLHEYIYFGEHAVIQNLWRTRKLNQIMAIQTQNVDSGWSWVILAGASFIFFAWNGLLKALSVLLPTLQDQFETHTWVIGVMNTTMFTVRDFSSKYRSTLSCMAFYDVLMNAGQYSHLHSPTEDIISKLQIELGICNS